MSTLEKFGILVILILVVIIGVVAVWGVRPDEANPFEKGDGTAVAAANGTVADPAAQAAQWPADGSAPTAASGDAAAPVAPPAIGSNPTPAAPTLGAPAASTGAGTYTVKKGDTLERIARETLGDGARWPEIVKLNPDKNPKRLKIGDSLKIPGGGTSVASAPAATSAPASVPSNSLTPVGPNRADGPTEAAPAQDTREVEVQSGDTLIAISRRELGNGDLYHKILKANPGLDPRKLRPGMKIKVPTN